MNESRYCKDNLDLLNLVHCTSVPGVPQEQEGDETTEKQGKKTRYTPQGERY